MILREILIVCCSVIFFIPLLFTASKSVHAEVSTSYQKRELRAAWIASVLNIDWPSKPALSTKQQKQEFINLLDDVKKLGMNAVVVQIKPTADAFYPSEYGPWSEYLTGVQGKDPRYDPLAFMVEEAHKRNLEFHAWFNPYRITMNHTDSNRLADNHPAKKHPDWVVSYGGKLYYNPGIPEVKNFITDGVLEVVKNYDIDGVHMDDYFYPYKVAGEIFPDQNTYETYNNGKFPTIEDWRRDNVNQLVRDLNTAIKQEKSYVKFGISPFGVWRNIANDPTGSNTTAGQTNYDDLYADTREWIQKGYIDYITPQIYWNIGFAPAAYDILLDWWVKETADKPIHLYIGQAAYKINNNSVPAWSDPEEYPRQIALNHQYSQIKGSMHFSLKDINRNPLGIKDRLQNDIYKQPALIPSMPWLDNEPPKQLTLKGAIPRNDGIALGIVDDINNDSTYYAIYRTTGKNDVDIQKAENLLTTVRKTKPGELFVDNTAKPGETYTYVVTAVDRLHNESVPSSKTTIKAK
ncbi:family 10 glycosylhydrolase [Bacillus sp. DX1.1]|uniref:glycoside hydrolase family 10 protein n=1 Tax=unclassified Bacillus (in: firmicutes) TaxID=185979 RepID=UPI00256FAB07|nr:MULTISPECIES: family 10 glycosylhydrolase [unclassified Bacillus (in: firmicutes)]MDM5154954.1 family 10 glycosylhydrolase [Bacillus sp. DX1.1]WJE83818.1 family 10 glycosylhydrolase [Bacillus sp. DX3.1]